MFPRWEACRCTAEAATPLYLAIDIRKHLFYNTRYTNRRFGIRQVIHMLSADVDYYKENKDLEPVAVIAAYENSGNFYPLYFSHHGCRLKVDHITETGINYIWAHFWCDITFSDRVERVELLYKFNEHLWFLKVPFGTRTSITDSEKAILRWVKGKH